MAEEYSQTMNWQGHLYFEPPYSIASLAPSLRNGMIVIGSLALLSVLSTLSLICFISHRFINWRNHYSSNICLNQYVVLVLNLLLADLQQSLGFMLSFHWVKRNAILAPSHACFSQGWLIHSGDVSSGFFVFAIALHTFYTAVVGKRIGSKAFAVAIVCVWAAAYFLTGLGVGIHGNQYFVRAGAWCWVSSAFEPDRLGLHYIWVFLIEFGLVVIYAVTFYKLRQKTRRIFDDPDAPSRNMNTINAVNRITQLMTLYPIVYICLTLPLSAGRMWSMSHGGASTSPTFSCIAGAMMTSCGWIDSLLYTLTRRRLLRDTMPKTNSSRSNGGDVSELGERNITHTRSVTVQKGQLKDVFSMTSPCEYDHNGSVSSATGSEDPIFDGIYPAGKPETKITVNVDQVELKKDKALDANTQH
ncbi:Hypothetical protein R9X50_00456000 [Acrodontium crateriforme]|uniref:G protein-coupled receptor GPR1/2/3 C-terminal domain-containing protein n=1 Tax=Acrodontium crateriforme TaxID=150365 RepID=A0AAQ3RCU5_9PEZI|nr:Hypothetical protein R9X50_00456000 [Acrodontium crateriforme]